MTQKELMIGDILEYMGIIVKVYSIGAKICLKEYFGKNTYIVDFDNLLKGLELTAEILEKNGFELKGDGWLWCEDKDVEEQNYSFVQFRRDREVRIVEINHLNKAVTKFRNIQNVHELQHALRLCGINKEMTI